MSDPFEQPQKPVLFRSFESDVARALGVEKEQTEVAVTQKKTEFEQKRSSFRTAGAKRFFFLISGFIFLILAIGASLYLYHQYNKTYSTEERTQPKSVIFEISEERAQSIFAITRELLLPKENGLITIIFTKNETPLSLSELYVLLPFKKGENKSADFQSFLSIYDKKGEVLVPSIILKENTSTAPQLSPLYDDFALSLGINLLDITDEAKTLLPEERFTATFVNNIPVRSITVRTEKGEEGIVFTRIPGSGAILISTKESLRSGLLDRLSTEGIVLSL